MHADSCMIEYRGDDVGGIPASNTIDDNPNVDASISSSGESLDDSFTEIIVFEYIEVHIDSTHRAIQTAGQFFKVQGGIVEHLF